MRTILSIVNNLFIVYIGIYYSNYLIIMVGVVIVLAYIAIECRRLYKLELKKEKDMLQLLPLKEKMFNKKYLFRFLYTNSDFIAFNSNKYNQLLIPIVEE